MYTESQEIDMAVSEVRQNLEPRHLKVYVFQNNGTFTFSIFFAGA